MFASYPGTYSDRHGSENIGFFNDGTLLSTIIRGRRFIGTSFDSLVPEPTAHPDNFTLEEGRTLCACRLSLTIPVPVAVENQPEKQGQLQVDLDLGPPRGRPRGGLEFAKLLLTLSFEGARFAATSEYDVFEEVLLEIQKLLPPDTRIKSCFTCLYSDYSVYGHGLFGSMLCFRNIKETYLAVTDKDSYIDNAQNRFERLVQETYLCPEYQVRVPGTGYRG